jgi:hypothetical protein
MRYSDPPAVNRSYDLSAVFGVVMEANPRGPLALPGKYEVRLIAGGNTYTQTLTLAPDPRLKVTAAELGQQHSLEMQIVDAMQAAWAARKAQNPPPTSGERGARGDTFDSLLGSFGALLDVVDSADAAPTEQAQSAYRDLKQRLDVLLTSKPSQAEKR